MTTLTVFVAGNPAAPLAHHTDPSAIAPAVRLLGADYEKVAVPTDGALPLDLVAVLAERYGFQHWDRVTVSTATPAHQDLRHRFKREHTHDDAEARLFLAGQGVFYLRVDDQVARLTCSAGDLVHVPPGMRHWFDFQPAPGFDALRLFSGREGWQPRYTGDAIADRFN